MFGVVVFFFNPNWAFHLSTSDSHSFSLVVLINLFEHIHAISLLNFLFTMLVVCMKALIGFVNFPLFYILCNVLEIIHFISIL